MADVPRLPGVPQLDSFSGSTIALLVADAIGILTAIFSGPSWGIFLDGAQAFDYQSVVDFDYKQDWSISDYQVEDGGFQSYDKVQLPADVKVRVVSGADEVSRESLLQTVLAAANSLNLYDVVTPEGVFQSHNIAHVDFKRTAYNNLGMIVIDIWFQEIRVTSTSTFSSTASPTVAGKVSSGNVSPQAYNDTGTNAGNFT